MKIAVRSFFPILANLRFGVEQRMDPSIIFSLDQSRTTCVSAFGKPPISLGFKAAFRMQLTPSLPPNWPLMQNSPRLDLGSAVQTETGNAVVCDEIGTIAQSGPFNALFLRLPAVLPVAGVVQQKEQESIKLLIDQFLAKYSEFEKVGAMYVTIHETVHFLPVVAAHLLSRGFAHHHFGASFPRGDRGSRNEHVYYKWYLRFSLLWLPLL